MAETSTTGRSPEPRRRMSERYLVEASLIILGFVFGFLLLHPVSMVIFGLLDPHAPHVDPGMIGWRQILNSF